MSKEDEFKRYQRAYRLLKKRQDKGLVRFTYNYCRVCGVEPEDFKVPMNQGPLRYWDADDGWCIGSLCMNCWVDVFDAKPQPGDYAFDTRKELYESNILTDEDVSLAL